MAIIRRKNFSFGEQQVSTNIPLLYTPEKLIRFAKDQRIYSIPLDVEELAKKLDLRVEYVSFLGEDADLSGKLFYDDHTDQWVIHVNDQHHPNRQRYTIAHEIGHFCLHKHLQLIFEDKIFFRGGEASKEEYEANEFASAILMPKEDFLGKVRSGLREVEDLASFFAVSTLALRLRAKNLGLTGHGI